MIKLISWNVNGIRAVLKKGFREFVERENPDVLCLQETKTPTGGFSLNIEGYYEYWNSPQRPGYSGTALLSKVKPLKVMNGIGLTAHDNEGRVMTAEYEAFYLVNVYVPNSKRGLERLPYRTKEWDVDFLKYLKRLEKNKPVVFCGDMNVAHQEMDLTYPKANVKNHGFTPEERAGFDRIVQSGFIDTFREFCADGGHYTWWSPLSQCRSRNIGWRIDYFCISPVLRKNLSKAWILREVMGSDHCPVAIQLEMEKKK